MISTSMVIKRIVDITVSATFLLLFSPLMSILALAVKLTSQGHVLYKQERVGQNSKVFMCFKFRSMKHDAEKLTGPIWAQEQDDRVTAVGKILRRWCLDELPQLWNVMRGDMSLIGPRPERPPFVLQFEREIDNYQERHTMRPGITGWAQVNGLRGNTSIVDRTDFDRYYIQHWSLLFDLKIAFMTFRAVIKG